MIKNGVVLLAGLMVAVVLTEGAARIMFPNWSEFQSSRFMQLEAVPGFMSVLIGKPGFDGYFAQNDGDFRVRVSINDFGLRNADPVGKADGRIWVVGDSIAFGWGVNRAEMLSTRINDAGFPTYNIASPGADACGYQALVGRMPKTTRPRALIVVLTLENDVNVYDCRHKDDIAATKPSSFSFRLSGIKEALIQVSASYNVLALAIKKSPLLRNAMISAGLIAQPHVRHRAPKSEEALNRTRSTAGEIAKIRNALGKDTPFAVALVPARFEIRDRDQNFATFRTDMIEALVGRGIEFIDPTEALIAAKFNKVHFAHDGHWSAYGHQLAANAVSAWLSKELD